MRIELYLLGATLVLALVQVLLTAHLRTRQYGIEWNAGPRDEKDQPGPYEASLVGNPVADAQRPLELIRTVHSFDPCLACAIHTVDVEGNEVAKVKAL